MKKSINYVPYFFALIMPSVPAMANNLLFKPGIVLNWVLLSLIIFGLWHLNERLLNVSDNPFVKWGSLLLGSSLNSCKLIAKTTTHRKQIDMSLYKDGLYLLQAQSKDGKQIKRVVKVE